MEQHFTFLGHYKCDNFHQNRGLFYGENIFTSFLTYNRKFLFLEDHLNRLKRGIQFFYPSYKETEVLLKKLEGELRNINQSQQELCSLENLEMYYRITVLALKSSAGQEYENEIVLMTNYESKKRNFKFKKIKTVHQERNATMIPNNIKMGNYAESFMHRQNAIKKGFDDCLFYSLEKGIYEACTSNIFIQNNKTFVTPPSCCELLAGITRQKLILALKKMNYMVVEKEIALEELMRSSRVLLTNSVELISSVEIVDDITFEVNKNDLLVNSLYQELINLESQE